MQDDNAQKLEEMRRTVDEKLQGTLNERLGESFKLVSERLELVHAELGEMHNLAGGVGDLKRVLSVVKTEFGKYGEVLDAVQKKLKEASSEIDRTRARRRAIERRLHDVEVPENAAPALSLVADSSKETQHG